MTGPEGYQFEVDPRLGEVLTFQVHTLLFRRRGFVLLALVDLLLAWVLVRVFLGWTTLAQALPLLILLLAAPLVAIGTVLLRGRSLYESRIRPALPYRLSFDEHGITVQGAGASMELAWREVEAPRPLGAVFLLYHGKSRALIVPRRCIPGDAAAFVEYAARAASSARAAHGSAQHEAG